MTTAQLGARMKVRQPRIVELEKAEVSGNITMRSLERAAEALGCRVVYALVPLKPLTTTLEERAVQIAERQLSSVEQSMRLEAQGVDDEEQRKRTRQRLVHELLRRPADFGTTGDGPAQTRKRLPLSSPDKRADLIPSHITLRRELNEA